MQVAVGTKTVVIGRAVHEELEHRVESATAAVVAALRDGSLRPVLIRPIELVDAMRDWICDN